MKKLFLFALFVVVSFTTIHAQDTHEQTPVFSQNISDNPMAMWDVKFNYNAEANGSAGNAGVIYLPQLSQFWVSKWSTSGLVKIFNSTGVPVDSFTMITGTRGMTWDGTHIWCSQNTTTLRKLDVATKTVVGTLTMTGVPNGARYVTYVPEADNGNGGFLVGNWTAPNLNFYVINKTGAVIRTITNATTGVYGVTYDNITPGGPFLWVWGQGLGAGQPQVITQMNYTTGQYTGVQHDVRTDVGIGQPSTTGIAGGLFLTDKLYAGKTTLVGLLQGIPDKLFGYEIGTVIPVELTSFTANVNGNSVVLNWSTATETNNRGFEIERKSSDGQYTTMAFVSGKGTTTEKQVYSFIDKTNSGKYSYRLKQVDFNGQSSYSKSVEIQVNPSKFALSNNYPNPFNPSTKISFDLSVDSKVSLKVFNLLGQEVASLVNGNLTAGNHEVNFNASNLSTGVYMYKIEAKGIDGQSFSSVKKMVLNK